MAGGAAAVWLAGGLGSEGVTVWGCGSGVRKWEGGVGACSRNHTKGKGSVTATALPQPN